jgi:hypothetical protein
MTQHAATTMHALRIVVINTIEPPENERTALARVPAPDNPMRCATMIDGVAWDGSAPQAYANAFSIRHMDDATIFHRPIHIDSASRVVK